VSDSQGHGVFGVEPVNTEAAGDVLWVTVSSVLSQSVKVTVSSVLNQSTPRQRVMFCGSDAL